MSTPNDMRKFIGYMKGKKPISVINNTINEKKDMSIRDMLGKMRRLNEDASITTSIDISNEENKLNNYFKDNNVTIEFEDLKIYPNGVIFGGIIDNQIQFVYKVTPDENTSGIEIDYLDNFDSQDPENEEVVKKIESYYDIFYKYWRENILQ